MSNIDRINKYFDVRDLVDKETYERLNVNAFDLFDPKLIDTILFLREYLFKKPMIINNWLVGGDYQYRGFRPKTCTEGAKFSKHKEGKAVDITIIGMSATEARALINIKKHTLPHNIRIENHVNWLHIDTGNTTKEKVVYFNP